LTGGQGVAGSNPAGPTKLYKLPRFSKFNVLFVLLW